MAAAAAMGLDDEAFEGFQGSGHGSLRSPFSAASTGSGFTSPSAPGTAVGADEYGPLVSAAHMTSGPTGVGAGADDPADGEADFGGEAYAQRPRRMPFIKSLPLRVRRDGHSFSAYKKHSLPPVFRRPRVPNPPLCPCYAPLVRGPRIPASTTSSTLLLALPGSYHARPKRLTALSTIRTGVESAMAKRNGKRWGWRCMGCVYSF